MDTRITQADRTKMAQTRAGKFLTFVLAGEEFGIEILKVREINGMLDITVVPQMPSFMEGVINLRGRVIPVIDLRVKFGMMKAEYTAETCIIVITVQDTLMSVIVDRVSEVLDISAEDIQAPPDVGLSVDMDFILGMAKTAGSVKILLDIERVLMGTESLVSMAE